MPEAIQEAPVTNFNTQLPADGQNFCNSFYFERSNEKVVFEKSLTIVERWLVHNKYISVPRSLSEDKNHLFNKTVKAQSFAKRVLIEIFSMNRNTRLKNLLYHLSKGEEENLEEREELASSLSVIIAIAFNIPVYESTSFFDSTIMIARSLCSSYNFFICDFVLHQLIGKDLAYEIVRKNSLDKLLDMKNRFDQVQVDKVAEQEFLKPIVEKKSTSSLRKIWPISYSTQEEKALLARFEHHADHILKDIAYFQKTLYFISERDAQDSIRSFNSDDTDNVPDSIRYSMPTQVVYKSAVASYKDSSNNASPLDDQKKKYRNVIFGVLQTNYDDLLNRRHEMERVKEIFRGLTNEKSIGLFNKMYKGISSNKSLSDNASKTLNQVQQKYLSMIDQYLDYQQRFEKYEAEFSLVCCLKLVYNFRCHIKQRVQEFINYRNETYDDYKLLYSTTCEGIEIVASLDSTWNAYLKNASFFKNLDPVYQIAAARIMLQFDYLYKKVEAQFSPLG